MIETAEMKIVTWSDVQVKVSKVNPKLAEMLDQCKPTKNHLLIKVSYPFGANVIKNGNFYFPDENGFLAPFGTAEVSEEVRNLLSYYWGSIPFGVVLSGAAESYWEGNLQTVSMGILKPGKTFALRTIFDKNGGFNFKEVFSLTSGARLLFVLPSIKDASKFKKLTKSIGKRTNIPKNFDDQWLLFRDLSSIKDFGTHWKSELLFFTKPWVDDILSKKFYHLNLYLRETLWAVSEFDRNNRQFEFIWSEFIGLAKAKLSKTKPYIFDFAKHLMLISVGKAHGFSPRGDNEVAPIRELTKLLLSDYKISFHPHFMATDTIQPGRKNSVYFSTQFPSGFVTYPYRQTNNSSLDDVRDVKAIIDFFLECASQGKLSLGGTRFENLHKTIKYDYYHTDKDFARQVLLSELIAKTDNKFDCASGLELCSQSLFFKGCVSVTSFAEKMAS